MLNELFDVKNYSVFKEKGQKLLINSLESLFDCSVTLYGRPLEYDDRVNLGIRSNPRRSYYKVNEQNIYLICRIIDNNKDIGIFLLSFKGNLIGQLPSKFLNVVASAITGVMSEAYQSSFKRSLNLTGESLILRIISNYVSKGHYDPYKVIYTLEYLKKLKNLTFEGEHFTTGVILTRSHYAFNNKKSQTRNGELIKLSEPFSIIKEKEIPKRNWFLVDGKKNFYLMNRIMLISNIFTLDPQESNPETFIEGYLLSNNLQGSDVVFKVVNHTQMSFIINGNIEFINLENVWKIRHYDTLITFMMEKINLNEKYVKVLLFFIIYASQSQKSSIIWITDGEYPEDLFVKENRILNKEISIFNYNNINLIQRMLYSDGVTIINKEGIVEKNGCIVNISKECKDKNGLVGTGVTAAKLLSESGSAIKISQDGIIKIFYKGCTTPIII